MNIPEIYLVEPYNAYAPKKKQKHLCEILEEQELMARIAAEQQALMEARSNTLPPNSPETSTPTVGPAANAAAGGGGVLPQEVFHAPSEVTVTFDRTPATGPAPYTCQFINLTPQAHLYDFLWTFSTKDGVIATSRLVSPSLTIDTASNATNILTASLEATSSVFGTPVAVSVPVYTSGSKPVLTVAFTLVSSNSASLTNGFYTASIGDTLTFINGSTMDNGLDYASFTHDWWFVSGSVPSSSLANPTYTFLNAGTYTVRLGTTGSYAIKGNGSRKIQIVA